MRKEINNIHFHYLTEPFHFTNRSQLKTYLQKMAKREGNRIDTINYIFCDDEYLLEINQQYLNHDTFTDIITFQLNPKGEALLSDIYISIERVKENAQLHSTSFKQELHRVIFHGLLHLCGYRDKTKKEQEEMRKQEDRCLNNYFVPRGTN